MTKTIKPQFNFNAGELSPRMYSRSDVSKYLNGLKTATNAYVTAHGPIHRRSGTQYIAEVKDSSKEVVLLKFQFSVDDALIIEAGDQYFRYFTNSGQLLDSASITNGTFDSGITSWTDQSAGTGAISHDAGGSTLQLDGAGAGNEGIAEQAISTAGVGTLTLTFDVTTAIGVVRVGTTSGAQDVLSDTATTVGSNSVTFNAPAQNDTLYLQFESENVSNVDNVSITGPYEITTPYVEADLNMLSYIQFGNVIYIAHNSYAPRILTRTTNTNWSLETLGLFPAPTYEPGFSPSTTVTPGATTGLAVTFTAGASAFIDGDIGRQIINLSGVGRASITGFTSATQVVCDIVEDFPSTSAIASGDWKLDLSPVTDLEFTGTNAGSIVTIDSDEPGTANSRDAFRSTDVGKFIVANGGIIEITNYISGAQVEGEILKSLNAADETGAWTLEDENWTASRGFPRAVGLFQNRLVLASTDTQPQTIWFSETGIFDGFGVGPDDDDSIVVTFSSSQVNQINWIANSRDLIIGSAGSEATINSGGSGSITPSTIQQTPRTYHGSEEQIPVTIDEEVIFIQNSKRKARSFRFDFNIDGYTGEDLTFLSEHITSGNLKSLAYAQEPNRILFGVLEDGNMLASTYMRSQQVIGWCSYTTDGSFEYVQTISADNQDQVWVVVNRTINGTTKRYVELFEDGDGTDPIHGYSDSFLVYSQPKTITGITQADPGVVTAAAHGFSNGDNIKLIGVGGMTDVENTTYIVANATTNTFELTDVDSVNVDTTEFTAYTSGGEAHKLVTTISGLDHLEAAEVEIRVDGAVHPNETVSSGSITLDSPHYEVVIGIPYTTTIETLNKEYDIGTGSMQGQKTRWVRPLLRVYNSTRPLVNGRISPSRSGADRMDTKVPLFTGDLAYGSISWGDTGILTITVSEPLPLRLSGIFGTIEGNVS